MAGAAQSNGQGINSIQIGARVLQALEAGGGPMPLGEVARRSDLHPAKAHRYLASLIRSELASQDAVTGLYDLGPACQQMGVEALRRTDAVARVSDHAVDLRERTGHTAIVGVWTELGPTVIRWDTGSHALPMVVRVGSIVPLIDSALGLVFLASMPTASVSASLKRQQSRGETRAMPARDLRRITRRVLDAGYALTRDDMVLGLGAVAAPVFAADRGLEAAIGLIMPTRLLTAREERSAAAALMASTQQASRDLGFRPGE